MIGDSVALPGRGPRARLRRRALLRRLSRRPRYAIATLRAASAGGASTLVLCDTNGGTMTDDSPRSSTRREPPRRRRRARGRLGHPRPRRRGACGRQLAAPPSAHGVRHVQGTINGYGERCGNANLVSIIANLALKTRTGRGSDGPIVCRADRALSLRRGDRRTSRPMTTSHTSADRVRSQGRRPRRAVAKVERSLPARRSGRWSGTSPGWSSRSSEERRTRSSDRTTRPRSSRVSTRQLSVLIKQLEAEGLAFEGAEGSFELLIRRHGAGYTRPSGSSTSRSSSSSARAVSCVPRRP